MSKNFVETRVGEPDVSGNAKRSYKTPEVFEVGSAKKLIQGPMLWPYVDSPGSGYTQFHSER